MDLINFIERGKIKHGDKYNYSLVEFKRYKDIVKIICPEHGEFEQRLDVHLRSNGCQKCYNEKRSRDNRMTLEEFIRKANKKHNNIFDYSKTIYHPEDKVKIICPEHGEFLQKAHAHLRGQGCPTCARNMQIKDNFIIEGGRINPTYDYSKTDYVNAKVKVKIICSEHGEFEQTPNNHISKNQKCPKCALKYNLAQDEIKTFINSLSLECITNNRKILQGQELDIFIPTHNTAIEYDGLYWHSEEYINKNYHLNKSNAANLKNIRLIHVFEDEWLNKQDIVKSRLKNILGLTPHKIYARKCVIKEISVKECRLFLNKNHIQGYVNSKIKLGLYYNNELFGVMTLGKRPMINGCEYELLRFCNKIDTTVIGGADKLLQHFIKTYHPQEIISYADRRWSQGNLYEKLGFEFSHDSKPNFYYVIKGKRHNRIAFQKHKLVKKGYDSLKTGHEIMLEQGIYRIYDCGNKVFKLKIS